MTLPFAYAQSSFAWSSSLLLELIALLRFWHSAAVVVVVELHPDMHNHIGLSFANRFIRLAKCCEAAIFSLTDFTCQSVLQAQLLITHIASR